MVAPVPRIRARVPRIQQLCSAVPPKSRRISMEICFSPRFVLSVHSAEEYRVQHTPNRRRSLKAKGSFFITAAIIKVFFFPHIATAQARFMHTLEGSSAVKTHAKDRRGDYARNRGFGLASWSRGLVLPEKDYRPKLSRTGVPRGGYC